MASKIDQIYTQKQQEAMHFYANNDFFMLINHGAARSGKTFIDNDIFLMELKRIGEYAKANKIIDPLYILAGANLGSIIRNVLNPLTQKYGMRFKLNKLNQFRLFDVVVCCCGHDNIGCLSTITGMTCFGAYMNEGALAHPEVFDQIIKRCSGAIDFNAHIVIDTNTKDPQHNLKVNYIDKADGEIIHAIGWRLDDNTFINADYRERIKKGTPSGVFYDRDILGLWVSAEGSVYRDFNEKQHVVQEPHANIVRYFAGVDWGYEHNGVITVFGDTADGTTYMLHAVSEKHKHVEWWASQSNVFRTKYGANIPFYCDTARPDLIVKFANAGINVKNADKSILPGIESVAWMYKNDRLKICRPGCKPFFDEIYSYVWDRKQDLPIKTHDDVMDAMRYAIYTDKFKQRPVAKAGHFY